VRSSRAARRLQPTDFVGERDLTPLVCLGWAGGANPVHARAVAAPHVGDRHPDAVDHDGRVAAGHGSMVEPEVGVRRATAASQPGSSTRLTRSRRSRHRMSHVSTTATARNLAASPPSKARLRKKRHTTDGGTDLWAVRGRAMVVE